MAHEATVILDQMVLVKVDANIYGARKKLKKEDLVLADGSRLPPDDLASLGSKRLLDPEQLAVFNRLKKEAERICLRIGTRFLGGYAIPKEAASNIISELERIADDFAVAKTEFLEGYDAAVSDWVVRHPEFASIIEKAVDSVEFVSTRLSFDYLLVSISLPDDLPVEEVVRLENKLGSLSEQMFYEISVDANLFIEQSLIGKDQVTRNALRPIKRMRDKLDGLGFLDYRVAPVVNTIDDLLLRIPSKGAIEGSILQEILATAMLLADPDRVRRHGQGLLVVQNVANTNVDLDVMDKAVNVIDVIIDSIDVEQPYAPVIDQTTDDKPNYQNKNQNPFSGLFDGILDDDRFDDAFDVAFDLDDHTDEDEIEFETVTTEGDDNEDDENPDQDFWF